MNDNDAEAIFRMLNWQGKLQVFNKTHCIDTSKIKFIRLNRLVTEAYVFMT